MKGANPSKVSDTAKKRGSLQLGSLSSGNHFLEVQKVDKIYDDKGAKMMGIEQGRQITVLVHCGSRGFGHQICSDYESFRECAKKVWHILVRQGTRMHSKQIPRSRRLSSCDELCIEFCMD